MKLYVKSAVYAKLREGKSIITSKYVLHPLAGQIDRAFFYNKRTGESKTVDIIEMAGKVVRV